MSGTWCLTTRWGSCEETELLTAARSQGCITSPQPTASESPVTDETVFVTDQDKRSFAQGEAIEVNRDIATNNVWIGLILGCVLCRSELIWEQIKGALRVSPELRLVPDEDPFTMDNPMVLYSNP